MSTEILGCLPLFDKTMSFGHDFRLRLISWITNQEINNLME